MACSKVILPSFDYVTKSNQPPATIEGALVRMQHNYLGNLVDAQTLNRMKVDIEHMNMYYGTKLEFRGIEDGRIVIYSNVELILPMPLTRNVLFEKKIKI